MERSGCGYGKVRLWLWKGQAVAMERSGYGYGKVRLWLWKGQATCGGFRSHSLDEMTWVGA